MIKFLNLYKVLMCFANVHVFLINKFNELFIEYQVYTICIDC